MKISLSLPAILFVVFLVLKLCNVIAWSWWWVTAPLWIPFVAFIVITVIVFIASFISGCIND